MRNKRVGRMDRLAAVFAFDERGRRTGVQIAKILHGREYHVEMYAPMRLAVNGWKGFDALSDEMEIIFDQQEVIVFVGATGIAVRAVAPLLQDKLADPAVLVVDEAAQFVIPLLSGHVGGANDMARLLAAELSATAVITTATDVNDVFSVDTFARQQKMSIVEKNEIKHLSGALLSGEPIGALTPKHGFVIASQPVGQPFEHTLHLVPQDFVIGMGCRSGTSGEALYRFVSDAFAAQGWSLYRIRAVASIDVKRGEPGLIALAKKLRVPFVVYNAETLCAQQGEFQSSDFVKDTVGADNVCERSALSAAICEGWLPQGSRFEQFVRLPKQARDGMTLAVVGLCTNDI